MTDEDKKTRQSLVVGMNSGKMVAMAECRAEELTAALDEYVEKEKLLHQIEEDIDARYEAMVREQEEETKRKWGDSRGKLRARLEELELEIKGLADGTEFRHPAGIASVVVKTKRRTWGKDIDITALESPGMEGLLGLPSNWLIEIPATFKQRGMAEVDKTADRMQLNDEARRLLFTHLDVRGGEKYTEIVIEETAMAVEEAIAAEREGK